MTIPVQEGSPTNASLSAAAAPFVLPAATATAPPCPNATMPSLVIPGDVGQAAPAPAVGVNAGVRHVSQIEAEIQETQEANRVAPPLGGGSHMEINDGRSDALDSGLGATMNAKIGVGSTPLPGVGTAAPHSTMAANTTTPGQSVPSPTLQELQERQLSLDAQQRELQRQLKHATVQSQQALVPPHGNNPPAADGDYLHHLQQQHQQSLLQRQEQQQKQHQQQQQQQHHDVVSTTDECRLTSAVQSPEHTADPSAFIAPGAGPGPAADSTAADFSSSALLSSQCPPESGLQSLQTFAPTPQSETQPQAQQQQRQSGAGLSQSTFITAGSSGSMHGHSGVLQGSLSLSNNTAIAANGLPVMTGLQQQQLQQQQQQQGAIGLNTNPLLSASLGAHQAPHIAPPGSQPGLQGASAPGLTALPQLPSHQQGVLSGLHQASLPQPGQPGQQQGAGGVPPLAAQQAAALQFQQQQQLQQLQLSAAGGASSALHSASPPIVQLQHLQQQLQPPPPYLTQPVTQQQLQQLQVNQQLQVTHQLQLQQLQQQQQELQQQQARAIMAGAIPPPPQLQQSLAVPDGLPPPLSTPPMFADGQQLQPLPPPPPPPPGHALPIMQTQQQFQVPPPQSQLSTVSHIGAGGAQGLVQSQTPQVVVGTAGGSVAPGGAVGLGQSQIAVGALPQPTAGGDPNGLVGALQQRQRQTLGGQFAGDVAGVAGLSVPQVPAPLAQGPMGYLPPPPFSAVSAGLRPPPMLGVDPSTTTGISVGGAGGGVRQIHSGEESDGVTPGEVKPGTQLLVNYVADTVTVAELRRLFDPFGQIELVRVIHDKSTGRRKGYGFVYYFNAADAKAAAAAMSGLPLQGKRLKVAVAQDERPVPTSVSALAPPLPMTR